MRSRYVKQEIQLAWRYERPYVPLLLEPTDFPQDVQCLLEGWQWVELADRPAGDAIADILRALQRLGVAHAITSSAEPESMLSGAEPIGPATSDDSGVDNPLNDLESSVFVGRERELAALRAGIADAIVGRGRLT